MMIEKGIYLELEKKVQDEKTKQEQEKTKQMMIEKGFYLELETEKTKQMQIELEMLRLKLNK
jgi:uncharacterized protein YcgL (UPF0745 family)